jgi:prenyltransferase beta subunit
MLERAVAWLESRQHEDGSFRSETYAILRDGDALTPFVLGALLDVPEEHFPGKKRVIARALGFLRKKADAEGVLGRGDPIVLEYPTLSTALAAICLLRAGDAGDRDLTTRMADWLVRTQLDEDEGFERDSPAYGGWGFGGVHPKGVAGHMDLVHTRAALEALALAGRLEETTRDKALHFLALVQKHPGEKRPQPLPPGFERGESPPYDGGFYLSPWVLAANKGGMILDETGRARGFGSYASATSEGALALLAVGLSPSHEKVLEARTWLLSHPGFEPPGGIPVDQPSPWADSVLFYHASVRARANAILDLPGDWREDLARFLSMRQGRDGSFRNEAGHLMKEDDPLLCTALAVTALGKVLGDRGPGPQ